MRTATLFRAYARTVTMKSVRAQNRAGGSNGIAVAEDDEARDWQRLDRIERKLFIRIMARLGAFNDLFQDPQFRPTDLCRRCYTAPDRDGDCYCATYHRKAAMVKYAYAWPDTVKLALYTSMKTYQRLANEAEPAMTEAYNTLTKVGELIDGLLAENERLRQNVNR